MSNQEEIDVPMDIYESQEEIFIVVPLWWVKKDSIEIFLEQTKLLIIWNRKSPEIKENMSSLQQECYWGEFNKYIDLPQNVYFQDIESKLTDENILQIIVPKVVIPEKIKINVEYN